MKRILLFFIYLITLNNGFSQQIVDNDRAHRRYWYYRTRMINDFMKIGKQQGDCIVFAERNLGKQSTTRERGSQVGPDQIDLASMYIMALALEYKLLTRNNQDTKETVNELYHMLYMINRLDGEADQLWGPTLIINPTIPQNNLNYNGFMIREDIPPNYISDNVLHFNYDMLDHGLGLVTNNIAFSNNYGGFCGSDFTDVLVDTKFNNYVLQKINETDDDSNNDDMYQLRDQMGMPHDKFHSMLVALMFVNKYLPYGVNNGQQFQDGEYDLKKEAKTIAGRIYSYLKGPQDSWVLVYPDFTTSNNHILDVGAQAQIYSWPLSRMACDASKDFPWNVGGCGSFTSPTAVGLGSQAYNINSTIPQPSMDAAVFMAWDQAGSNLPAASPFLLSVPLPAYMTMQGNTANWSIEIFELLRKVLHQDGALLRQLSIYGDPINSAPCQGPYNYGGCDHGGHEWSAQDRIEHPNSRGSSCGDGPTGGFFADYPGVDYMLLHNLYYEYQNQLLDGNQGNVGNTPGANVATTIFNAATTVGSLVSSAACSIQNAFGGIFQGNPNICDPTVQPSGNGGGGSNNVNIGRYYAYNYMDNQDANIWPRNLGSNLTVQGNTNFIGKVAVFQNLSSSAHIYASSSPAAPQNTIPSNVTYRAGKEIHFKPGFQVDAGSTFHARIQRYLCNDNADALQMRQGNDSLTKAQLLEMDYETDLINPVPIHYVESPLSDSDNNPVVSESTSENEYIDFLKINEFEVVPNPSSGLFKITTQKLSETEILSLNVYDMKGLLIYSADNIDVEQTINLERYSDGIYMLQVSSTNGRNMVKKINVSH